MCCRKDFMEQVLSAVSDHFAQVTGLKQDLIRIVKCSLTIISWTRQMLESYAEIQEEYQMIYTDKTKKAMKLCYEAHKDQVDKSGLPYVFHPAHVAEQMTDEATTIVALLHDVVEDTDYTLEDLAAEGFGKDILEAVALMTHEDDVPYLDYVAKLKDNPIARAVKLADLAHNSDLSRIGEVDEETKQRLEKYKKAMALLNDNPLR